MASSNRHWPSMFKSKPCNNHHQWQHDLNPSLLPAGCHRNPYTSGVEERSPDPKPRWNPKPEQIRILEAIFNSGMVNPPRDEIRKIRAQLQEYGQVGDANVFYWFQNRKSRSKHKNRQLPKNQSNNSSATTKTTTQSTTTTTTNATATIADSKISNPSSSSDKSSSKLSNPTTSTNKFANNNPTGFTLGSCPSNLLDQLSYSPTASVNQQQAYDHHLVQHDQPFMFPALQNLNFSNNQGFMGFSDQPSQTQQQQMMIPSNNNHNMQVNSNNVGPCTEFLFSELINHQQHGGSDPKKDADDEETLMMMKLDYTTVPSSTTSPALVNHLPALSTSTIMPLTSTLQQLQGADETGASSMIGPMKSTVFINDVAFEVNSGPFHVREAFGNDAVLLHSTGQPVLTNEWGITLQPLQHGAFYYLI